MNVNWAYETDFYSLNNHMERYSPNFPSIPSDPRLPGPVQWEKWDTASDFHSLIQLSKTK